MNSVTAVKACGDPLSGIESKEIYEIDAPAVKNKRVYLLIKRAFDIMAPVAAGLVFMIPMAIIAVIIRLDSTGPVYTDKRDWD